MLKTSHLTPWLLAYLESEVWMSLLPPACPLTRTKKRLSEHLEPDQKSRAVLAERS